MLKVFDMFAGWGGGGLAAELAGHKVVAAANHWPTAVAAHQEMFPDAEHFCQDLRQMDWATLPPFDLLLAGPSCQGSSPCAAPARKANSKVAQRHNMLRATAWAVTDCTDACNPDAVVVENVTQFKKWRLYGTWLKSFDLMGYRTQEMVLNAADFGVPQLRKRIFIVAIKKELSDRGVTLSLSKKGALPAFGPYIEWGKGEWRPIDRMRHPKARQRLLSARARWGSRCVVQHVTGHKGLPLSQPVRTITTADQYQVVNGDFYRPFTIRETARAMGFPDSYTWPRDSKRGDVIKGLGNAWCPPVGAALIREINKEVA